MLSDAIRKRLQPKESSLSERDAMLPAHYESSLVTSTAQPGRRNSLEARATPTTGQSLVYLGVDPVSRERLPDGDCGHAVACVR